MSKQLCDYGCGQEAKYKFKNGKWCCSKLPNQCKVVREKRKKTCLKKYGVDHPVKSKIVQEKKKNTCLEKYGVDHPCKAIDIQKKRKNTCLEKYGVDNPSKSKIIKDKKKQTYIENYGVDNPLKSKKVKDIIKQQWIKKHIFFSLIEDIKIENGEYKVHCKNHNCENSKEKGGWFTPSSSQLYERMQCIENHGIDNSYFYCSNHCKQTCPLYNLYSDPFKDISKPYTQEEYNTWKQIVLEQDNYECQMCGSKENLHCHHIVPIKIEPILSLDPSNGIVLCETCHYEIGHKNECSTGNLANKICISNK